MDAVSRMPQEGSSHAKESYYQALFELSPVAVYSIDSDGVIQKFNQRAAELWGRTPQLGDTDERFCGSYRLFHPDGTFMPHAECPMAKVVNGELSEINDGEVIIEHPDGSRVSVIVNIRLLTDSSGKSTGAINCFYDITGRANVQRYQEQQARNLADMNRRKDEFLAILSHELRNPLAPIANAAYIVGKQVHDNPYLKHAHSIIERQVKQLTRLVDDLMDASRISSGRLHLHLKRVDIRSIAEGAIGTASPIIENRGHQLSVTLPETTIWLDADAARIEQIIVNLLANAAKYSSPGGKIYLSIEQQGSDCVLLVRDNGVGISPELLPHIFDLFTQEERSLDLSGGGLGIGLALVKSLVDMHHGQVAAHSVLGQGSEFIVRLPVVPDGE